MRIFFSLIRYALLCLLAVVFLMSLWQFAARVFLRQELPQVFGYTQVTVLSGSMEPAFSAGDLLVLHAQDRYKPGDIISFWEDGSLITHRLVEQTADGAITKGDSNHVLDQQPVQEDQIVGRVVLALPHAGSILLFLRTPPGVCVLLLAGLLIWLFPGRIGPRTSHGKRDAK